MPPDFIGVNVASAEDPACDDFVVECLRELEIKQVRLTYSPSAEGTFTERFLDRLVADGFDVLLSIIPDFESAELMASDTRVQAEWRAFVDRVLQKYADVLHAIEVGNTPNRPRWSGFTPASYIQTWRIADELASLRGLSLAGANVSDFEPMFNSAYLRSMGEIARKPIIQTTNLFVERARQPEAYDRKALGPALSGSLRLNLVKKVHILRAISKRWDINQLYVTYTCWTRPRLARWSIDVEGKGVDYLVRYVALAAATGNVDRLYWGPLVDGRDGLVSCEGDAYPEVDNVTHYRVINGTRASFKKSPSYHALKLVSGLVQGARCEQAVTSFEGLSHVILVKDEREHHIVWATDRRMFKFDALYEDLDPGVSITDAKNGVHKHVDSIGERPLILSWPNGVEPERPSETQIRNCPEVGPEGTRFGLPVTCQPVGFTDKQWVGVVAGDFVDVADRLVPEQLLELPVVHSLRDKRNKLWTVDLDDHSIVVKENRARGMKRFTYRFLESKGLRHWNNAHEFLRRGVNTPKPIAFYEEHEEAGVRNNYYLSEYISDTHSLRDLFTAFRSGADAYEGISKSEWLDRVGKFVASIHRRNVTHTDLSSGNVLFTLEGGEATFYAIDIGRARFDDQHEPLADIARVCYKLDWPDRETLMAAYLQNYRLKNKQRWRLWCRAYDYKLALKKGLKGNLKRKMKRDA